MLAIRCVTVELHLWMSFTSHGCHSHRRMFRLACRVRWCSAVDLRPSLHLLPTVFLAQALQIKCKQSSVAYVAHRYLVSPCYGFLCTQVKYLYFYLLILVGTMLGYTTAQFFAALCSGPKLVFAAWPMFFVLFRLVTYTWNVINQSE